MMRSRTYCQFGAMIATSMVAMFGLMYLNTYEWSHVRWSETRCFMTFIMGAAMVMIMPRFMPGMYRTQRLNLAIFAGGAAVFLSALGLVRSQVTVGDRAWMSALIPHHQIAILTSERARIKDVRVRELADSIIDAQRSEIGEMEWWIDDIRRNGAATKDAAAPARPAPAFSSGP